MPAAEFARTVALFTSEAEKDMDLLIDLEAVAFELVAEWEELLEDYVDEYRTV
jgi:hypothetical protein